MDKFTIFLIGFTIFYAIAFPVAMYHDNEESHLEHVQIMEMDDG